MKHRLLLLITALLMGITANAQTVTYGVTGRLGAFKTFTSSDAKNEGADYGIGMQAALGVWVRLPIASKSNIQFTVLQTAERQYAGEVQVVNEDRQPVTNAKITDRNLAIALQAIYLYSLDDKWDIGLGAGAKYEYLAKTKLKNKKNIPTTSRNEYTYDNEFRRDLTFHIPVEVQYNFNNNIAFVAQAQFLLSNRLKEFEGNFQEHDLGLTLGINYKL